MPQKLFIEVSNAPSELTLEETLAGAAGTLRLGYKGVRLWVPGDNIPLESEIVFDMRLRPLNSQDFETFKKACEGRFMSHYMALMQGTNPERMAALLEYYDFVLVPDESIENTPADFRNRVLGYTMKIQDTADWAENQ